MTAARKRLNFARVCVEIDASRPPINSFELVTFEDNDLDDNNCNFSYQIKVEYHWLPAHCADCKCFGHDCVRTKLAKKADSKLDKGWVKSKSKGKEKMVGSLPLATSLGAGPSSVAEHAGDYSPIAAKSADPLRIDGVTSEEGNNSVTADLCLEKVSAEKTGCAVDSGGLVTCLEDDGGCNVVATLVPSPNKFAALQLIPENSGDSDAAISEDEKCNDFLTPRHKKRLKKKERRAKAGVLSKDPG